MAIYYYDATSGLDTNTGLATDQAWQTLAKASATGNGHTHLLKCGETWTDEKLDLSGKNNLTISYYGTGNNPIIDGNSTVETGLYFWGDNITCSNIDVKNCTKYGILSGSWATPFENLNIYDCVVTSNLENGLRVYCNNSTIRNITATLNGSGDTAGIVIGYGNSNKIYDNISSDNNGSGYEINWDSCNNEFYNNYGENNTHHLLELWDNSNSNIINSNYGVNCGERGILVNGSSSNLIKNNLLITFTLSGIEIMRFAGLDSSQNNLIYHNTIIGDGTWTGGMGTRDEGTTGNIFKNNIVVTSTEASVNQVTIGNTFDYNCYYSTGSYEFIYNGTTYNNLLDWQTASGQDTNSIAVDPLLTSDYKLKKTSPCINAGVDVGVKTDYEGNLRPIGSKVDIGAYEFFSSKRQSTTIFA